MFKGKPENGPVYQATLSASVYFGYILVHSVGWQTLCGVNHPTRFQQQQIAMWGDHFFMCLFGWPAVAAFDCRSDWDTWQMDCYREMNCLSWLHCFSQVLMCCEIPVMFKRYCGSSHPRHIRIGIYGYVWLYMICIYTHGHGCIWLCIWLYIVICGHIHQKICIGCVWTCPLMSGASYLGV